MTVDHDSPQTSVETVEPPEPEPDDLLRELSRELSRAMHRAALAQRKRMVAEVARLRSTQAEVIKARTAAEAEQLKTESDEDIREIDTWAQTATELIAAERVRRIDARRERLQAQLARQDVIAERELMAVDVTLEDHEAALEAFFGRLESETDPASIAGLASAMPSLPSLSDAADAARRHAISEFAPIDETTIETPGDDAIDATTDVSPSRLMAVMDPDASRVAPTATATPWPEPMAIAVTAGSQPLLRSMRASRPLDRIRHRNRAAGEDPDRAD